MIVVLPRGDSDVRRRLSVLVLMGNLRAHEVHLCHVSARIAKFRNGLERVYLLCLRARINDLL